MARQEVRHYRDACGRRAVAFGNEEDGWKLTLLLDKHSFTRWFPSEAQVRTYLKKSICGCWTEVDRWQATTICRTA